MKLIYLFGLFLTIILSFNSSCSKNEELENIISPDIKPEYIAEIIGEWYIDDMYYILDTHTTVSYIIRLKINFTKINMLYYTIETVTYNEISGEKYYGESFSAPFYFEIDENFIFIYDQSNEFVSKISYELTGESLKLKAIEGKLFNYTISNVKLSLEAEMQRME